jgi:hypothetical protein
MGVCYNDNLGKSQSYEILYVVTSKTKNEESNPHNKAVQNKLNI